MKFRTGLALSLLMHSGIFAFIYYHDHVVDGATGLGGSPSPGQTPGMDKSPGSDHDIIPKDNEGQTEIEAIEASPKPIKAKGTLHDCVGDHWYGGIGIEESPDKRVVKVAPGYPAEEAGIKEGDQIVSDTIITGEPGTDVDIDIMRLGSILHFNVKRDKICIED